MAAADQQERLAASLLREAVLAPASVAHRFDEFFYPIVVDYIRKRHRTLGLWIGQHAGTGTAPVGYVGVDLEQLAHDATVRALERVRSRAHQFHPRKGSAIQWVFGAAAFAFAEELRLQTGSRRRLAIQSTADEDLERKAERYQSTLLDADRVEAADLIRRALEGLPSDERLAIQLCEVYELTYAEAAEVMFGDRTRIKAVDHLLQKARNTLRAFWHENGR